MSPLGLVLGFTMVFSGALLIGSGSKHFKSGKKDIGLLQIVAGITLIIGGFAVAATG